MFFSLHSAVFPRTHKSFQFLQSLDLYDASQLASIGVMMHHRLDRPGWILSVTNGGAHLGTTSADARAAGQVDARSSLGYQWLTKEINKSCSSQCGYSV